MHTSDARVFAFGDSVMPYFNSAKAYAMELDPKEAMNLSLISKLMMGKEYSLQKMIPSHEYAILDSVVKSEMGMSVKLFDNVAPIFTMTIFEAAGLDLEEDNSKGKHEVLDLFFYKQAKRIEHAYIRGTSGLAHQRNSPV
jgi:uncharacterized protein YbaP (TraB family)